MPRTVLVADDSSTMRRVVEITFSGEDFRVVATSNAEEAIQRAREVRPDVVLADATMPGMTGYDLCRAVRGDQGLRAVPVVILSSLQFPYDDARGREAGATDFI